MICEGCKGRGLAVEEVYATGVGEINILVFCRGCDGRGTVEVDARDLSRNLEAEESADRYWKEQEDRFHAITEAEWEDWELRQGGYCDYSYGIEE